MKKIALILLAVFSLSAYAEHGRGHGEFRGEYHGGGDGRWVLPLIVGGVIGWSLSNQPPPAPVYQYPPYQYPAQPQPVFTEVLEYYADCNCYRKVWRQTGWK